MSERRLEASQARLGNAVWMSSLEEPFLRDSAWVTRGTAPIWLSWYFYMLRGARQTCDKRGSHRSWCVYHARAAPDHHNSGSADSSPIPIKLMNDRGGDSLKGAESLTLNHEDINRIIKKSVNGFLLYASQWRNWIALRRRVGQWKSDRWCWKNNEITHWLKALSYSWRYYENVI